MALEQIVLQQIRWVTELARENPKVFYEKVCAKKRDEDEKKLKAVKAEIIKIRKRIDELDRFIKKLYADNVIGRITDERYDKMAQSYESEQATLIKKLSELEEVEASYGEERNPIDDFIANANRFIDIQELTPKIAHAFISKPKGKDLSILIQDDLDRFASYLNTLPRKSLGYFAPEDLFLRELSVIMNG